MKESKMGKAKIEEVEIILEGEKIKLNVKRNIPYNRQIACSRIVGESVVGDDGTFKPWDRDVYLALTILTEYANMPIPTNWGNDELMEFVGSDEYAKIFEVVDIREFKNLTGNADKLIEHRKQICRRNGFVEFIDNIKSLFEMVNKAYQEAPEAAELLISGLMGAVLAENEDRVDGIVDESDDDHVDTEVLTGENEVEADADL